MACNSGRGEHSYAEQLMRVIREKRPDLELTVYAPDGTVLFVPGEHPHLVVSPKVGWGRHGLPVITAGGHWRRLTLPADGHEVHTEQLGSHLDGPPGVHDPHHLPETTDEHANDRPVEGVKAFGVPHKQALYATEQHRGRAARFEEKLGDLAFNHPKAQAAARTAVRRLYEALRAAHPDVPEEELQRVFLKDDPTSAGQVGESLTSAEFHTMMATGNTRELMTAFFNAAYAKDSPLGLKSVLQHLLAHQDQARATAMGLDLRELHTQAEFLNGPLRAGLAKTPLSKMFDKDHFGTGSIIKQAADPIKAGSEYLGSLRARTSREDTPLNQLTATQLQHRGIPLSSRELRFQQQHGATGTLHWQTGRDLYVVNEKSGWYGTAHEQKGMPVSTGISATTAKMMNAFRLLKVPDTEPGDMLLALTGWMLPLGDHSLYEILKGAQLLDELPPLPSHAMGDVSMLYQHIPGLSQHQVRAELGEDGMLPHEAAYHELVNTPRDNGGYYDEFASRSQRNRAQFEAVVANKAAEAAGIPYVPQHVKPEVVNWLDRNHLTAQQVLDTLTVAHFEALGVYTGPTFPLINVMLRFSPPFRQLALERQAKVLLDNAPLSQLPSALKHDPVLGPIIRNTEPWSRSPEQRKQLHQAVGPLVPQLERELKVHAELLSETLDKLPAVSGELWRGERLMGPLAGGAGSRLDPTYGGSTLSNRDFLSTSTDQLVALRFMKGRTQLPVTHPALIHFEMHGGGSAYDIEPFSVAAGESEVLIKPGSSFKLTDRHVGTDGGGRPYEQISATERPLDLPFPKTTPAEQDLHQALTKLANIRELRTHQDLWPLAEYIGADHGRPFGAKVADLLSPATAAARRA